MDKFGIFNLLNSFFNFNSQSTDEKPDKTPSPLDTLSTLFSSSKKETPPTSEQSPSAPTHKPLQSGMISAMNSHDQFIKRVKQNNAKK